MSTNANQPQYDSDCPWWIFGVPTTDQDVRWPLDPEAPEVYRTEGLT